MARPTLLKMHYPSMGKQNKANNKQKQTNSKLEGYSISDTTNFGSPRGSKISILLNDLGVLINQIHV